MKRYFALLVGIVLFFVPFFWLKPGFVDLGGDASRLYFINPLQIAKYYLEQKNMLGASMYAFIPNYYFLSLLKQIISSPTNLINISHGIQLSVAYFAMYLLVKLLLSQPLKKGTLLRECVAICTGIMYLGMATKLGWITSLDTQNQIFLNPLMSYLILQLCLSKKVGYFLSIVTVSLIFSGNFGFSSMPQLVSFFPATMVFICTYLIYVLKKPIPWKTLSMLLLVSVLIHGFHIIPTIASVIDKGNSINSYIFSKQIQENLGLHYFDENRQTLGKLSVELFQPTNWHLGSIGILIIPLIAFSGFLVKRSRLLALLGIFWSACFFLVSANITLIGVRLYRQLFRLPGFIMFRSFDEKWYFVFIFFYALLFGTSLYFLLEKRKSQTALFLSGICILVTIFRIYPFLINPYEKSFLYQSKNVSTIYKPDTDIDKAIKYIYQLPNNGNVLTLPLTLPYFQIVSGKEGGAYVGLSMVRLLGNKKDYPGFGTFGLYRNTMLEAFKKNDLQTIKQVLSLLNVRYIFRNNDEMVLKNFPKFPNYKYDMNEDISSLNTQAGYDHIFNQLQLKDLFSNGFFEVKELPENIVRPTLYVADTIYASESGVIQGSSFRSAYISQVDCQRNNICNQDPIEVPSVYFEKKSSVEYSVSINAENSSRPFLVILSEDYDKHWKLILDQMPGTSPMLVNGFANGWLIDPSKISNKHLVGTVDYEFQKYFTYGFYTSIIGGILLVIYIGTQLWRKKIN